jgi:hypothetical protein
MVLSIAFKTGNHISTADDEQLRVTIALKFM